MVGAPGRRKSRLGDPCLPPRAAACCRVLPLTLAAALSQISEVFSSPDLVPKIASFVPSQRDRCVHGAAAECAAVSPVHQLTCLLVSRLQVQLCGGQEVHPCHLRAAQHAVLGEVELSVHQPSQCQGGRAPGSLAGAVSHGTLAAV